MLASAEFWVGVAFVIFWGILFYYGVPGKAMSALDSRGKRVADELAEARRLLAETEGIFGETAGGVTVGVLKKLAESGRIDRDAPTVVLNTGDGLKTLDAVAPTAGPTVTIAASLDAFRATGLGA